MSKKKPEPKKAKKAPAAKAGKAAKKVPAKKTEAPASNESALLKPVIYTAVIVLLVMAVAQLSRTSVILEKVAKDNQRLIHEFGQVKDGVIAYGDDLNEVREFLLLPPRKYQFFPENAEVDGEVTDPLPKALYRFVGEVGGTHEYQLLKEESIEAIKGLRADTGFVKTLSSNQLFPPRLVEETESQVIFRFYINNSESIASVVLNKESLEFHIESILGTQPLNLDDPKELASAAGDYIDENIEKIRKLEVQIPEAKEAFTSMVASDEVSALLQEKTLQINASPNERPTYFEYTIQNADQEILENILLDRETVTFKLSNQEFETVDELKPELIKVLSGHSGVTTRLKDAERTKETLVALVDEDAFQAALDASGIRIEDPQEDGLQLIYDLYYKADDNKLGSIILESETGTIKFYRESDGATLDIDDILSSGSKKNG